MSLPDKQSPVYKHVVSIMPCMAEIFMDHVDAPPKTCRDCLFFVWASRFCCVRGQHQVGSMRGCSSEDFLKELLERL